MRKRVVDIPVIDDRLELLFHHAGLVEKQAKLYRLLLTVGEGRVSVLSRRSGIKRGNVYALLRDLRLKGLVTEFEKRGIVYFRPEPPEKLLSIIKAREREAALAKTLASDLLPFLTSQWKLAIGRPVIRYFEGEEGVYKVLEDIYSPGKKEIVGCVGLEEPDEKLCGHIIGKLMPLRIKRKIFSRALNPDSLRARELKAQDKKHLREIFLTDPKRYPLPAEIDVYEDKTAFLSFAKHGFIGLLLEHKAFATTMRSVFRLLFDLLKQQEEAAKNYQKEGQVQPRGQKNKPPEY